jgi:hypothetical protein
VGDKEEGDVETPRFWALTVKRSVWKNLEILGPGGGWDHREVARKSLGRGRCVNTWV